jgi:hypothetical protein
MPELFSRLFLWLNSIPEHTFCSRKNLLDAMLGQDATSSWMLQILRIKRVFWFFFLMEVERRGPLFIPLSLLLTWVLSS